MLWLMMLFPLLGAAANGLFLRSASKTVSHVVGVAAMAASFACAVAVYMQFMASGGQATVYQGFPWIEAGGFSAPFNVIVDAHPPFVRDDLLFARHLRVA